MVIDSAVLTRASSTYKRLDKKSWPLRNGPASLRSNLHVRLCSAAWLLSSAVLIPRTAVDDCASTHRMGFSRSWIVSSSVDPINRSCSYPIPWSPCPHGYLAINKLCLHLIYINTICSLSLGYFLLGLISSFVFRAIRDALPDNPAAQERILGASFLALGIADVSHLLTSNYRTILPFSFFNSWHSTYSIVLRPSPYLSTLVSLLPSWVSPKISCIHLPIGTAWPTETSLLSLSSSSSGAYLLSLYSPIWHANTFLHRAAWFMGIGRTRYYYGKPRSEIYVGFNPPNVYEFIEQHSRRASSIRSQIKISAVHSMFISSVPSWYNKNKGCRSYV